jgi:Ca-activated chloride channel family protein
MRHVWAGMVVAIALTGSGPRAEQSSVFRAGTDTVPIYATVISIDGGELVTDLTREDFQVFDNGRPQRITLFDNSLQPISIVIMLDTSGSMLGNLSLLRTSAVQMFTRLLPRDRARVGSFGDHITLSPKFTNDQDDLIRALWLDLDVGGPTPLWAAIGTAMTALAPLDGRRVVLVLTDGKDTGFRGRHGLSTGRPDTPTLLQVISRAQAEDFMVYAIGMASRGETRWGPGMLSGGEPDPGLRVLAMETGGGYFEITRNTALGPAFARVADELHRQYLLGYIAPEQDGRTHAVDVRTTRPGLTIRARRSYVAARRSPIACDFVKDGRCR